MSLKQYFVRAFNYVLHGVPVKNVYPRVDLIQLYII